MVSLLLTIALFIIGGCDGDGGGGSGNTPPVLNTLCGSVESEQDSSFIDCSVSVSLINELGTNQTSQARQDEETDAVRTAILDIPFLTEAENRNFVNVVMDLNEDGVFADYGTVTGVQEEWIVRNTPVIVFPFDYNFYFQIRDDAVDTGTPYTIKVVLSDDTISSEDELNGGVPDNSSFIEGMIELSIFGFENMVDPDPEAFGAGEVDALQSSPGDEGVISSTRGREIITVNGVDILVLDGVPDLPQSINTCVPNSIANSIAWLAKEFDFDLNITEGDTQLPVDVNDIFSIADSLLNPLIIEYGDNNGFVMQNGQIRGVLPQNVVPIKEMFVQKNNIPIKTSEIDIDPENPGDLIEQIKDRLEDGCIAEAKLQLFNAQGQKIGGHMVNITGYSLGQSFDEFDGFGDPPAEGDPSALKKLVFHDANHTVLDNDTGAPIPQNDIYNFDITQQNEILIENYAYGPPGTATVKLVGAIIQCVDVESEETTFDLTVTADGDLSITHIVFQSPCPQPIGTITITNTGDVPFDWFRMGVAGTRTTPPAGSLEPGESVTLTVEFTCDVAKDIMGEIIIKAMVGQNEKEFSFPLSVDVQNQ